MHYAKNNEGIKSLLFSVILSHNQIGSQMFQSENLLQVTDKKNVYVLLNLTLTNIVENICIFLFHSYSTSYIKNLQS